MVQNVSMDFCEGPNTMQTEMSLQTQAMQQQIYGDLIADNNWILRIHNYMIIQAVPCRPYYVSNYWGTTG